MPVQGDVDWTLSRSAEAACVETLFPRAFIQEVAWERTAVPKYGSRYFPARFHVLTMADTKMATGPFLEAK
jgi:hypothetical protein